MRGHVLSAVLAGVLLAQATATPRIGPTSPSSRALDQLTNSVTRPMPAAPLPSGQSPADMWVPDRIVPTPDQPGGLMVPGHWERRVSDHQNYMPPLIGTTPDGRTAPIPGGFVPPPSERQSP